MCAHKHWCSLHVCLLIVSFRLFVTYSCESFPNTPTHTHTHAHASWRAMGREHSATSTRPSSWSWARPARACWRRDRRRSTLQTHRMSHARRYAFWPDSLEASLLWAVLFYIRPARGRRERKGIEIERKRENETVIQLCLYVLCQNACN